MGRLNQSRRQNIGYVFQAQVNNNVADAQTGRVMGDIIDQSFDYNMGGDGFMDVVRGIYNKGKQGAKYVWDNKKAIAEGAEKAYTSEIGTALRNALPDSDENARPGFPGEKHMILQLKNGKNGVGNWMGPGTEVIKRLKRGDPGRTPADTVAKRHDLDYVLASTQPTKAKQLSATRDADNRMIRTLKSIASGKHGGDAGRNIQAGMRLIQAKTIGEDLGLLDKSKFAGELTNVSDGDKVLLMSNRAKLTQEGYGMLPGDHLKKKLLQKMLREKKMKQLGKGCFKGNGLTLPGGMMMGKGDVMGFVLKGLVPNLVKSLGISPNALPIAKIAPMVSKALDLAKTGNLPSIIQNLTKTLLPLLAHGKLKTMGLKMSGNGIMDIHKKLKSFGLDKKLATGLFSAFKWYLNKSAKSQGMKTPFKGSGLTLPGGSFGNFWKGFKKGFVTVFKPGSKILGGIATAIGQPEIGIPLSVISEML